MHLGRTWSDGQGQPILLLAHGAGAPADTPFLAELATAIAGHTIQVVRFEFAYMQRRRLDGRKRPPGAMPGLLDEFRAELESLLAATDPQRPVFVGGKSMGGRVASLLVAEPSLPDRVAGAIGFGYPFHPPGKPDSWRTDHFDRLQCPLCIVQGSRDPFGKPDEVARQSFTRDRVAIHWLAGGDHDFRPPKRQPESQSGLIGQAAAIAASFMASCADSRPAQARAPS